MSKRDIKMEFWNVFINIIMQSLAFITYEVGASEAAAIILVTLIGRLILMPINLSAMGHMHRNRNALLAIKPELDQLKSTYQDKPSELAKATMALYKKHNIKILDNKSLINIVGQGTFGLGMFQTLQQVVFTGKFAWITNIAKPDLLLALVVGAITYFSMSMMSGSAEQTNVLLLVIPALICIVMLSHFSSAIGLYWATSSSTSLMQSFILNKYFYRRHSTKST
jgi:YidC/Oxa1 family membrane protein insertase